MSPVSCRRRDQHERDGCQANPRVGYLAHVLTSAQRQGLPVELPARLEEMVARVRQAAMSRPLIAHSHGLG
jgi:hypothetical protein